MDAILKRGKRVIRKCNFEGISAKRTWRRLWKIIRYRIFLFEREQAEKKCTIDDEGKVGS